MKTVREARSYRYLFTQGVCGWCEQSAVTLEVDHDHECCNYPSGKCCSHCVRGLVHPDCNKVISWIEQLKKRGYQVSLTPKESRWLGW